MRKPSSSGGQPPSQPVLPVIREDVSVARETVPTGRVEVRVEPHRVPVSVELEAAREFVDVERIPIGRPVDRAEPPRQDGEDWVVPVYEEVVRVERQLVLKEEIRLRRRRETQRWQEDVDLRRDEAVVRRAPVAASTEPGAGATEKESSGQ